MQKLVIEGATRCLGRAKDWDEALDGPIDDLYIRDGLHLGSSVMISSWKPSPVELAMLIRGAPIHLYVVGVTHPPVLLGVVDLDAKNTIV